MRIALSIILFAGYITASLPAIAGDDDKPLPYMIYVDPETGKYVTVDPAAGHAAASSAKPSPELENVRKPAHFPAVSMQTISIASVLLLLLWAGIKWLARRRAA